jgi:hypothetical protein
MTNQESVVATKKSWPKLRRLPKRFVTIPLDFALDAQQAKRVRQGFIPAVMEEKWFAYFDNNTLYQYRSWTGVCIDQIHFVDEGDGLRATHAEVNRYTPHYQNKDDEEDRVRIVDMVLELAKQTMGAKSQAVDPMVAGLELAMQPNYLGSPTVVNEIVKPLFDIEIGLWRYRYDKTAPVVTYNDTVEVMMRFADIMSGEDSGYTKMSSWHSIEELGRAAIKYFNLDAEYCSGESFYFVMSESSAAISLKISEYLSAYVKTEGAQWQRDALPQLSVLHKFVVAVLLGTNTVLMPGKVLKDFHWQPNLSAAETTDRDEQ